MYDPLGGSCQLVNRLGMTMGLKAGKLLKKQAWAGQARGRRYSERRGEAASRTVCRERAGVGMTTLGKAEGRPIPRRLRRLEDVTKTGKTP